MNRIALVAVVTLSAASASAAPVVNNCPAPPPTPKGHVVVKIKDASDVTIKDGAQTRVRTKLVFDHGKDFKIERGDDGVILTCAGLSVADADFYVGDVDPAASSTMIAGGFKAADLKNAYAAIDIGYASKPPPTQGIPKEYTAGYVTDVRPGPDGKAEVTLGGGLKDGLNPNDEGYLVDDAQRRVFNSNFNLMWVKNDASTIRLPIAYADIAGKGLLFAVKRGAKTCSKPSTAAPVLAPGKTPSGFVAAKVTYMEGGVGATSLTVQVDKGFDQGVVPDSAAFLLTKTGALLPAATDVLAVGKYGARIVISPKPAVAFDETRVLISTAACK